MAQKLAGLGITTTAHLRDADAHRFRTQRGVRAIEIETQPKAKDQLIFSRSFSIPVEDAAGSEYLCAKGCSPVESGLAGGWVVECFFVLPRISVVWCSRIHLCRCFW